MFEGTEPISKIKYTQGLIMCKRGHFCQSSGEKVATRNAEDQLDAET